MLESKFAREIQEEGEVRRQRIDLQKLLLSRFGNAAAGEFTEPLNALEDLDRLEQLFDLVLRGASLEEFRNALRELGA